MPFLFMRSILWLVMLPVFNNSLTYLTSLTGVACLIKII